MKRPPSQLYLYEQYKAMAMKLAWQYWKKLPASAKMWIDPEDFIAEAVLVIIGFVRKNHDTQRASLSSFIYLSVGSHMFNAVLAQRNAKRFGWMVSLEDEACPKLFLNEYSIQLVEAREALERVFQQSSPPLRGAIAKWFGLERRAPGCSKKTRGLLTEFNQLAKTCRLSESDCRLLLKSGIWLRQ